MPPFKVIKKIAFNFCFTKLHNSNFNYQYCTGTRDGVHVPTTKSLEDQVPYIGRKEILTQNIMAACNFI